MSASRIVLVITVGVFLLAVASFGGVAESPPPLVPPPAPILFGGPSEERDSIVAFEAARAGMDPALAIAVSHVENWAGDSEAMHPRSSAVGLMQVMPFWADSFQVECYGPGALSARGRNACIGVRIAMRYFRECGNWNCALVWYVGARCTRRDTPAWCARKNRAGTAYVLAVVERFGRTDLSPTRDAMAYGVWRLQAFLADTGSRRPSQFPAHGAHSSGETRLGGERGVPGAPQTLEME